MCSGRYKTNFRKKNHVNLRIGASSFFERSVHVFQIIFSVLKKTGTLIIFSLYFVRYSRMPTN
jgi:hypothetical protein